MRPQALTAAETDRGDHISCSMSAVLLARVHECGGDAVAEVLRLAGSGRTPEYLCDITNWIAYDEAVALWRAGALVTHHPQFARVVGEDTAHRLRRSSDHCAWTCGPLACGTVLFGLDPAVVEHEECEAMGAPRCLYRVRWDTEAEASDGSPEQIAALQHQLDAMTERLHSVFAAASDLIAADDLDDVLARITARAALAVRAIRYLLAVRVGPAGELHCHHKGEIQPVTLLYMDLDGFKPVNDELGHDVGDQLLVAVAKRSASCTRTDDTVARLGGDEFAVLIDSQTAPADAEDVSDRLAAALTRPFMIDGHRLHLGVSIGRAVFPIDADDADGLLRCADAAMFGVKRSTQARALYPGRSR